MKRLHLIDKTRDVRPLTGLAVPSVAHNVYLTTEWKLTTEAAQSCIGAEIHLHDSQSSPSFQAGVCTGFFPVGDRFGLMFLSFPELAGRVQVDGWGREQARVH